MSEDEGRTEQAPGHPKEASATIYLVEELGDARLRCDQLVRYVAEGVRLVEGSPNRDKFYEVAGHLLHAVPLTLFKLQKALQAVALAANRIDYEEIKTDLRPEKVQQLEKVLEDVRIRQINRHSEPLMTPQQVAAKLRQIAATTQEFQLPQDEVVGLITALERGQKQAEAEAPQVELLNKFADLLEQPVEVGKEPSRLRLAAVLRRLVGDTHVKGHQASLAVAKGDKQAVPPGIACKKQAVPPGIAAEDEDDDDGGKTAADKVNVGRLERQVDNIGEVAKSMKSAFDKYKKDPGKYAPQLENVGTDANSVYTSARVILRTLGRKVAEEEKQTKFEEGKPADPTKNMTEEEAKEWKANTEKYKDKFDKKAEEEKQTKFEEGKPADPTKNMTEEEAKEWKANTEKYKDKFDKKEAARGADDAIKFKEYLERLKKLNRGWGKGKYLEEAKEVLNGLSAYGMKSKWLMQRLGPVEDEFTEIRLGLARTKDQLRTLHAVIAKNLLGIAQDINPDEAMSEPEWAEYARRASVDDDWKAPEAKAVTAALKPKDKKVVDAFYEKETAEGYLLSTDGKTLSKHGMGGGNFAEWKSGKIHIVSPGGNKSHDDILRYMKKSIPKNSLADHPQLRSPQDAQGWWQGPQLVHRGSQGIHRGPESGRPEQAEADRQACQVREG